MSECWCTFCSLLNVTLSPDQPPNIKPVVIDHKDPLVVHKAPLWCTLCPHAIVICHDDCAQCSLVVHEVSLYHCGCAHCRPHKPRQTDGTISITSISYAGRERITTKALEGHFQVNMNMELEISSQHSSEYFIFTWMFAWNFMWIFEWIFTWKWPSRAFAHNVYSEKTTISQSFSSYCWILCCEIDLDLGNV